MKICPACRRIYDDDALNFCLEDGSVLTFTTPESAPTIVMNPPPRTDPSGGVATRPGWDAPKPAAYSMQPKKKSSKSWLWAVGILGLVVLVCGGGMLGFFVYVASVANTNSSFNASKGTANTSTSRSNTFTSTNGTVSSGPSPEGAVTTEELDLKPWVKEFSAWGTTEFTDGEFLMAAREKGYYYVLVAPEQYSTGGATTRVTVRNPDDASSSLGYGLIIHSDPTPLTRDYAFLIDAKRRRFRVVRHEPENETNVIPWTNSSVINPGTAENVIEVRDRGDKLEFYINDQLATSVANKQGPTGGVPGLYAGDGVKIAFKKLEIVK